MQQQNLEPKWRPLNSFQRRVVGVLIEKAKTTPDAYPMTLNALANGCKQKSNRSPQMDIASDDIELTLDELRQMGAAIEIQGTGRVAKYRHQMYDWLGVDKSEIAVMAELLLRGEQTIGELRGRAARMEPIAGMTELQPIIAALIEKKLVVPLTPAGRGQIITHGLYEERELSELKKRLGSQAAAATSTSVPAVSPLSTSTTGQQTDLQHDLTMLKSEIAELRSRLEILENRLQQ